MTVNGVTCGKEEKEYKMKRKFLFTPGTVKGTNKERGDTLIREYVDLENE